MYIYDRKKSFNPQVESDKRLLAYKDYEHYLDSLITKEDKCNLRNITATQILAKLGYRINTETLTEEEFKERVRRVMEYLHPEFIPYIMASQNMPCPDNIHKELANRERLNRVGVLATIIHLRLPNKYGYEVSGYIDYSHRLKEENWRGFFQGKKLIYPTKDDLGYYHWKFGLTSTNDSLNYKTLISKNGLVFQNRYDRICVSVNPSSDPGHNTRKSKIHSKIYPYVILFDHMVRQRV